MLSRMTFRRYHRRLVRFSIAMLVMAIAGSVSCASTGTPTMFAALPPVADSSIFAPLTLPPAPSATRSANGAPGPKYWQNRADYDLHATIDTVGSTVWGSMTLRYTNHSPDSLPFLWFQTEQNAYRDTAGGLSGTGPYWFKTDSAGPYGDIIDSFTELVDGQPAAVQLEDHRTETKVTLLRPLRSGETAILHVTWHFVVPQGIIWMGRAGSVYMIALWYPRVNVYDDITGWDTKQHIGVGDFYLEFGDYNLSVTVPSNYIVAATGTLDNPQDVLTSTECSRLAQAGRTDTIVSVVTAGELRDGTAHLKHDGMVTWKFHAINVQEAVFSTSPNYRWDATSWKGILAQAYYRSPLPQSASSSEEEWHKIAASVARMSIQEYSERWYPYPHSQVSVIEGPRMGGGMSYSMLAFYGDVDSETVLHEVGHNWFSDLTGSNEGRYGWMAEGLDDFINSFISPHHDQEKGIRAAMEGDIRNHSNSPIDSPAGSTNEGAGQALYFTPVAVLHMLRRDVLGPALFDKGLQTFIRRWAHKHPTSQDFFRTMDDIAGRHLDWFWREWFYETPGFDQAIDSVTQVITTGGQTNITVVYGNHSRGVLPLLVRFTFRGGTTQDVTYPADVWRANSTRYRVSYTFAKPVTRIELDPDRHLVDTDRDNNVYQSRQ
jgi:hypothetical protein